MHKIAFISILLLTVSSCKRLEGDVTMKKGETIEDGKVSLSFKEYQDSRCPEGADCIVAGIVSVKLEMKKGSETVAFTLGDSAPNQSDTIVFDYQVKFIDLTPHPKIDESIGDNDVKLLLNIKKV